VILVQDIPRDVRASAAARRMLDPFAEVLTATTVVGEWALHLVETRRSRAARAA